ncbi:MAG: serine/threonine protein kinase [Candidatus Accumulibacter sp.]|jgi:tRNA A-37 threonylcarbamoyl transferase component Bud32|nr:serine/threonine protein kinase [Accumulibacter sp.]
MKAYVRVCPVCDMENPLERAHCSHCASLLADVDFSLSRVPEGQAGLAAPVATPLPTPPATPAPEAGRAEARPASPPPANIGAPPPARVLSDSLRCPDPDCAQPNPPGSSRCLYCNTPLLAAVPDIPDIPATPAAPAAFELAPPDPGLAVAPPPLFSSATERAAPRAQARIVLPPALAARFRVLDELPAAGSEADLLIVEAVDARADEPRVAKIYRRGIVPDEALLDRLAAAGPHVVRILEHGREDGVAWEVMEYCRAGNLRAVMRDPLSRERLVELTRELAAALSEVHALRILHRDLKPENVLLRRRAPLSLALTDFGIASLSEGTRHFTDNARTVKYAAPEALTGVLDAKADWWSLGMILLEAASGRHPFDSLSEQVVNHHLATRPIEITGVADEGIAHLCRGLLLRDPARRYGAEEVARWLAGDPTLVAPRESGAAIVRPYHLGKHTAHNGEELALALAANWAQGVRDLERGLVRDWLATDLRDFGLIRRLDDIMEVHSEAIERRFLRFLRAAAPGLPPLWRGQPADRKALVARARQALVDEAANADPQVWRDWLESLFDAKALTLMGDAELMELDRLWRQTLALVEHTWEAARKESRRLRSRLAATAGNPTGNAVDFDTLVFGWDAGFRFPPRRQWHAPILLALPQSAPEFLALARKEVMHAVERFADAAPWFSALVRQERPAQAGRTTIEQAARLLVAWRLREVARQEAEAERASRQAAEAQRMNAIEAWRQALLRLLAHFQAASAAADEDTRMEWQLLLDELRTLSRQLTDAGYPDAAFERLQQRVSTLRRRSSKLEAALDLAEARTGQIAIVMQPRRLGLIFGSLMFTGLLLGAQWAVLLTLGGAGFVGLFYWRRRQADQELAAQMRALQVQSRALNTQMKNEAAIS